MAERRLRRIKDGKMFGYNEKMAGYSGMEVVLCDDDTNNVIQNLGELGEVTIRGRKYDTPDRRSDGHYRADSTIEPPSSFHSAIEQAIADRATVHEDGTKSD